MSAEERQKRIETYLKQVEFASLEELAKQVNASVSTVRRDLTLMETTGTLKRTHGGARMTEVPSSDEFIFLARDTHQLAEKDAIGKAGRCLGLYRAPRPDLDGDHRGFEAHPRRRAHDRAPLL